MPLRNIIQKGVKYEYSIYTIRNPFYYPLLETSIYNSFKNGQNVTMVSITDAIKTAVKIKPDFILVLHGLHTNFKHIIPMLKRFGFTVGIWLTDDPYYSDLTQHIVPDYDYVLRKILGLLISIKN